MTNGVIFSVGVRVPGEGMGNHAYHLLNGLDRHHLLQRAFVMQYQEAATPLPQITSLYLTERIAYRLARYLRIDQYVLRDNLFDAWVAQQLAPAACFYGWTHHALWSLKAARRRKMITVLERANAHPLTYQRVLRSEYQKYRPQQTPYHPWILKKQMQELAIADYIAVTSQWTKQSLLEHGIAEQRILITPLGVDSDHFVPCPIDIVSAVQKPFRALYVGQLCLRKGIQFLLEAWTKLALPQAELLLVGDVLPEMHDILTEACARNQHITVLPHADDPVGLYQSAAICVLPTLEDGFGLVVLEAMACGLPVMITEHTGAQDCVRRDVDGFIIAPYSVEQLVETLRFCYRERERLHVMGQQARIQAEQFPWSRYQDGIAAHLRTILA